MSQTIKATEVRVGDLVTLNCGIPLYFRVGYIQRRQNGTLILVRRGDGHIIEMGPAHAVTVQR